MVLSSETLAAARAMGVRAGAAYLQDGAPSRNPFDRDTRPELAQAWSVGYTDGSANPPHQPPPATIPSN